MLPFDAAPSNPIPAQTGEYIGSRTLSTVSVWYAGLTGATAEPPAPPGVLPPRPLCAVPVALPQQGGKVQAGHYHLLARALERTHFLSARRNAGLLRS